MGKDFMEEKVSYAGLNSLVEVLDSCMQKYSDYMQSQINIIMFI